MELMIKDIRERCGMTQVEISEALGVPARTYCSWERGERQLSIDTACRIADVLDCSLDALVGRTVRHDYADPRERELHRCWGEMDGQRQDIVLAVARDAAGMAREVPAERALPREA